MMPFSNMEAASLRDLLLHEVKDLYDAEQQLVTVLPKMADAASSAELRKAFETHLEETKQHVVRLEDIFTALEEKPERQTCDGMKGLLAEGDHVLKGKMRASVKDAALISAASRVEHYEMAGYTSISTLAKALDLDTVKELADATLKEEKHADTLLLKIAEEEIYEKAPTGN